MLRKLFNAQSPPPMIWKPHVHGRLYPDRPFFLTNVRQGMAMLPPELQATFKEAGARVFVARNANDIITMSDKIQNTLSDTKFSPNEIKAAMQAMHFHIDISRGIVIPEDKIAFMPQTNKFGSIYNAISAIRKHSTQQVALHEIGHIFAGLGGDDGFPLPDKSAFFKYALQRDKQSMSKESRQAFLSSTYLAKLDETHNYVSAEFYAELFREAISGKKDISRHLPRASGFMADEIASAMKGFREKHQDFNPETYPRMDIAQA